MTAAYCNLAMLKFIYVANFISLLFAWAVFYIWPNNGEVVYCYPSLLKQKSLYHSMIEAENFCYQIVINLLASFQIKKSTILEHSSNGQMLNKYKSLLANILKLNKDKTKNLKFNVTTIILSIHIIIYVCSIVQL